jgi:hypothetical protein
MAKFIKEDREHLITETIVSLIEAQIQNMVNQSNTEQKTRDFYYEYFLKRMDDLTEILEKSYGKTI